jgi:hypothetical protein
MLNNISEKVADLQMRFAEFERLTKARCEVIENFIGLMPSKCKHDFQANTDGNSYLNTDKNEKFLLGEIQKMKKEEITESVIDKKG